MASFVESKTVAGGRAKNNGEVMTNFNNLHSPDYGYIIFKQILDRLFPERWNTDEISRVGCFEDGAFVFNDPEHKLFDILLGINNGNDDLKCAVNELKVVKYNQPGVLDQSGKKSHFLLDQLEQSRLDELNQAYNFSQLFYYKPCDARGRPLPLEAMTTKPITLKFDTKKKKYKLSVQEMQTCELSGQTGIYERYIEPDMKAICNPQNPNLPRTSFITKGIGKMVIKFYCLKIINTTTDVPYYYTFVKAETTRHGKKGTVASKAKSMRKSVGGVDDEDGICKILGNGIIICKQKKGQAYFYRREDGGIKEEENYFGPLTQEWLDVLNNVSDGNKTEIYGYSGLNNSVPFLRTGYEYFVPSNVTDEISNILSPLNQYYCVYKNALNRKKKMDSALKAKSQQRKPKAEAQRKVITKLKLATKKYQSIVNRYVLVPQHVPQQERIPYTVAQKRTERIKRIRAERIKRIRAAKEAKALRNRGGGKRKTRKQRKKKTRRKKRKNRKKRTRKR